MLEYFNNWNAGIIQRIKGYFCNDMRYINLRFTYLLTYLFNALTTCPKLLATPRPCNDSIHVTAR